MAVLLMLCASASFATMAALVKALGPSIPFYQLVFLRCILSAPLLFLIIRMRGRSPVVKAKKTLFFRTFFGIIAMLGYFYALAHMPLADCIFIGRSQPLILSLFAPWIIGERAPRAAWIALGFGLVGVVLIMKPAMAWPLAAWVALGSATSSAFAHLMLRRLNATDAPLVIVFNFTLLTAFVTSFPTIFNFHILTPTQWIETGGIALFATMGQLLMTLAYQRDRAPVVASASYSSVILSVLYGYLFWGEIPHPLAWMGGGLIVLGGFLLLKARWNVTEPPSPAAI